LATCSTSRLRPDPPAEFPPQNEFPLSVYAPNGGDLDRRDFLKMMSLAALAWGAPAGLRASGGRRRPNLLLLVSDQHRADACGCYGSPVRLRSGGSPTPNIDLLAQRSTRVRHAYCPAPLCAPSRAAYMTGRHAHETTALNHRMQRSAEVAGRLPGVREDILGMGEHFRGEGYRTAAFGKMHVHGESVTGWDLGFDERGLRFYTDFPGGHYDDLKSGDVNSRYREMREYGNKLYREIDPQRFAAAPADLRVRGNGLNQYYLPTLVEHEEEMFDHLVTDASLDFIETCHQRGEPFLAHVGWEKPHRPWTVPQRFLDAFDPEAIELPPTAGEWLQRGMLPTHLEWQHSGLRGIQAKRSIAAYYACGLALDEQVGRVMAKLRELGIENDTLIVYASDHGENLFEHGLIEKHNMYEGSVAVPFMVAGPGLPQGKVIDGPCTLLDLLPTMREMAGLPADHSLDGKSLIPLVRGRGDPDRIIFSEFYEGPNTGWNGIQTPMKMALQRRLKYIYTHGCIEQLFDLASDPREERNLALEEAGSDRLERLRLAALRDWELDEFPQLTGSISWTGAGVLLEWEDAGLEARYTVWRADEDDGEGLRAQALATGLEGLRWTDESARLEKAYRYWVVARWPLTRTFTDRNGNARYGLEPVLLAQYPYRLPITPTMRFHCKEGARREYRYQPFHGLDWAGRQWIFFGMKPEVRGHDLAGNGPLRVLSALVHQGDLSFRIGLPADPGGKTIRAVFGWRDATASFYLEASRGRISLGQIERGQGSALAEAPLSDAGSQRVELQISIKGRSIEARHGDQLLLSHQLSEQMVAGRWGLDAGIGASVAVTLA
jgi:iduronate 2-sulfatase